MDKNGGIVRITMHMPTDMLSVDQRPDAHCRGQERAGQALVVGVVGCQPNRASVAVRGSGGRGLAPWPGVGRSATLDLGGQH